MVQIHNSVLKIAPGLFRKLNKCLEMKLHTSSTSSYIKVLNVLTNMECNNNGIQLRDYNPLNKSEINSTDSKALHHFHNTSSFVSFLFIYYTSTKLLSIFFLH